MKNEEKDEKTNQHPSPSDDVQLKIETVIPAVELETEKTPPQANHDKSALSEDDRVEKSKDEEQNSLNTEEKFDDDDKRDQVETITPGD